MSFFGRKYYRKRVPRAERIASVVIVLLIGCVGVAIALKGRRYDPNRYALDPAALAATRPLASAPVATPVQVAKANQAAPSPTPANPETATQTKPADPASAQTAAQPAQGGGELTYEAAGLAPLGPTEHYSAQNLYEKIDGRSDQYLEFDAVGLRVRSFGLAGDKSKYVDVYEFDMGKPAMAFGIFAIERDANGQRLDFVDEGYKSGTGYFFCRGPLYVQVLASEENVELLKAAEAMARQIVATHPADTKGLEGLKELPQTGLQAATIRYVPRNALSFDFLENAFMADYQVAGGQGGETVKFFLASLGDEAKAKAAFEQYLETSKQYGKVNAERQEAGSRVFEAESYGATDVVFLRGAQIGGINGAAKADPARQFVTQYLGGKIH